MKGRKPYQYQEDPHYWSTVNRIWFITTAMSHSNLYNFYGSKYILNSTFNTFCIV